ncbi:recombinase family protein, partial [Lactobacillus reuteri]
MTVYGYARVSTTKQSLEEQLAELKNQGVRKANIFAEKFTGTTTNRPEFERLLKKVKRNDTIVVTKLDRFARNTKEA